MTHGEADTKATTTGVFDALHPLAAAQHPELLAPPVFEALHLVPEAVVFEIDPDLSDTEVMCEALGLPLHVMGNAVLVAGRRAGQERRCCAMTLGDRRVDVNGCVRHRLDVRKASFAPLEEATGTTGMEYGGITPVGLDAKWPVWLDESVRDVEWLCIGSGVRRSKLVLHGSSLLNLPGAQLVEGLTR
ncbi:Cys-tRNA(Pro) deacylase, prolyl-tRNA editing enzyme YbaK/EbsC [Propionibacterium cyclohexanicum]|uniref:Cys-tRNA(Pro) deacylase, prolyl-tRNA editing enzyme YbaK/EbsC n=1 Tax=Propionibacterium cyclohexanicum TaxID=64702 RepID=A0A1H9RI28_9ACTN|nr:YbaK/EbsC family protein [Propionibacterium cyclohexanicum]SER72461.1 Cys-tRNA(Pro) deacylase, prolyl-tRNA editing enzyme YbaK/EbsC [Propionibacterium cyclohexanicum]